MRHPNTTLALGMLGLVMLLGCSDDSSDQTSDGAVVDDGATAPDSTPTSDGSLVSDSAQADAATLESCFAGIGPKGESFLGILDFEDQEGTTRVRLAREPGNRTAVGETFPYDLIRFGIERDNKTECVTDAAHLSYDFGHHNWNDTAQALAGGTVYEVVMVYDAMTSGWNDTLEARDRESGQTLWGPLTLKNTACTTIPPEDLNHCLLR